MKGYQSLWLVAFLIFKLIKNGNSINLHNGKNNHENNN